MENNYFKIENNSNHIIKISLAHIRSNEPLMYGNIFPHENKQVNFQGDPNLYVLDFSINKIYNPKEDEIKKELLREIYEDDKFWSEPLECVERYMEKYK